MNRSQEEVLGGIVRRQLEGRVPASILGKMTNEELAEEYHYSKAEKLKWAARKS